MDVGSEYAPSQCSVNTSQADSIETDLDTDANEDVGGHGELKFIIFSSCLKRLMSLLHCANCGSHDTWVRMLTPRGTMAVVELRCHSCPHVTTWHGQPLERRVPMGNILLSAAILFAGATPTKCLRVLQHMGVATITAKTFFEHQRGLLHQAVHNVWSLERTALVVALGDTPVTLGGDGRADSPGHSAKYGSYTVLELNTNKVIGIELVQVRNLLF